MILKVNADIFIKNSDEGVIFDVRTPAEFDLGHIPGAQNLPLFTDEERAIVGTIYKRGGRGKAIERGFEFVGPRIAQIVKSAKEMAQGRDVYMYCWRGGMRSGSVGWLLETAGMRVVLLLGGYKAYRRHFEKMLELEPWRFIVLTGMTGCAKTQLLRILAERGEQVLDFEELANHRGSAFGGIGKGQQPTNEHFINILHEKFLEFDSSRPIWCESESMLVGKVYIPDMLFKKLGRDLVIEVTMDREQRLDIIMKEYGELPCEDLIEAFNHIARRMGPEKVAQAVDLIKDGHIRAAASLALDYYDKTYARNYALNEGIVTVKADGVDLYKSADDLLKIKDEKYGSDN